VQGLGVVQAVGLDVLEERLFVQEVPDQIRDVGVDEFVVGHAVTDGVSNGHRLGSGRVDETSDTHHRVGSKVQRVEPLVINPAIDDVYGTFALSGAHVDLVADDDDVTALDEFDTHQSSEQDVFEVRGVMDAGGEHHHRRVANALGRREA
jgi:hypothetical protein